MLRKTILFGDYMIPPLLHFIWISPTPGLPVPEDVEKIISSWVNHNPGFILKIWGEVEIEDFISRFYDNDVLSSYRCLRLIAMKADLARLLILNIFGGFYCDLKNDCLKDFLFDLLENNTVLIEHWPQHDRPDPNGLLANSFIGSEPKSTIILELIDTALVGIKCRVDASPSAVTGGGMITKVIGKRNHNGLKILPHTEYYKIAFRRVLLAYNNFNKTGHWTSEWKKGVYN